MELEELRESLNHRLHTLLGESHLGWEVHRLFEGTPSLHTPKSSPIVTAAQKLTGHDSEAVAFCTEGPYLNALGMETIILGPGDIAQAHQPDEFLALGRLTPTIQMLEKLIERFCLPPRQ
jgi:acetylornithine deacetylase